MKMLYLLRDTAAFWSQYEFSFPKCKLLTREKHEI